VPGRVDSAIGEQLRHIPDAGENSYWQTVAAGGANRSRVIDFV
jgi:hypothetical protein